MTRAPAFLFDGHADRIRAALRLKVDRLARGSVATGTVEIPIGAELWGTTLRATFTDSTEAERADELLAQLDAWLAGQDALPAPEAA